MALGLLRCFFYFYLSEHLIFDTILIHFITRADEVEIFCFVYVLKGPVYEAVW